MSVVDVFRREVREAEIVSVDSMCVYRGMDVGTAKPSAHDQALVAHHLLDLVDPDEEYSVAQYQRDSIAALASIDGRGSVALFVGGTGLYVDAIVNGLTIPAQFPEIRSQLERDADLLGASSLHERLTVLDPAAAARMEPGNTRRIVRALEVTLGSGRPFSSFGPGLQETRRVEATPMFAIQWPREVLTERIHARIDAQMAAGFLDEASAIVDRFGGRISRTAAQALGYRELWEHLRGETSLDEAIAKTVLRSRQFAVRQERWFRRDPRIEWLDGSRPHDELAATIATRVATRI